MKLINEPFLAPLTLVAAPAGYGKSVVVTQWALAAQMPVAWIDIEPADNQLTSFLARIASALLYLDPNIEETDRLDVGDLIGRVIRLCGQLAERAGPVALVLDDFGFLVDQSTLDAVTAIANNLPPHVHLVIASRTMPNIGIGRLRRGGG